MLKLEKCIHSSRISVCLREKDSFFTPLLIKSLIFALALHITAVIIFHIQPFKITSSFLHPPVKVHTEGKPSLATPLSIMHAPLEDIPFFPPPSPIDSLSSPLLHPSSPSEQLLTLTPAISSSFFLLEQRYWPIISPSLAQLIERPAIRLFISGDLPSYSLTNQEPRLEEKILLPLAQEPVYITYHVRLEESGTVFWYERTESNGSKEADALTEQILLNAQFLPPQSPSQAKGWLHFIVYE